MNDIQFIYAVVFAGFMTQLFFKDYKGDNKLLKSIKNITEDPYPDASNFMKNAFGFMWFAGIWGILIAVFKNL